jgi:hypothetical protein
MLLYCVAWSLHLNYTCFKKYRMAFAAIAQPASGYLITMFGYQKKITLNSSIPFSVNE